MLCQPNLPGGASRCAAGMLRMPVVMLREFRVSDHPLVISTWRCPLSFRPSGSPLSFRRNGAPCHFDRAEASGEICGALRQTGAREGPFCALCRWSRCARGRLRPVAHRGRPARATRRVPMCGSLAKWGNGVRVWRERGQSGESSAKGGNRGRDSRSGRE
jgi:hypothetical protein